MRAAAATPGARQATWSDITLSSLPFGCLLAVHLGVANRKGLQQHVLLALRRCVVLVAWLRRMQDKSLASTAAAQALLGERLRRSLDARLSETVADGTVLAWVWARPPVSGLHAVMWIVGTGLLQSRMG